MLSPTPLENRHVWPGDRVVDPELDVKVANPNQPMPYLGVLIAYADPGQLALDAGFEVQSSQTASPEAEPAGLGIIAQ